MCLWLEISFHVFKVWLDDRVQFAAPGRHRRRGGSTVIPNFPFASIPEAVASFEFLRKCNGRVPTEADLDPWKEKERTV